METLRNLSLKPFKLNLLHNTNAVLFALFALCLMPLILIYLDVPLAADPIELSKENLLSVQESSFSGTIHSIMAHAFVHTILEWSAVCIAIIVSIFIFIHAQLKKNSISFVIGVALMLSGFIDAFHILYADRLLESSNDPLVILTVTWTMGRFFHSLILLFGIGLLLYANNKKINPRITITSVSLLIVLFFIFSYLIHYHIATRFNFPQLIFANAIVKRPYDLIPAMIFFSAVVATYFIFIRKESNIFAFALILSAFIEVVAQMYMIFGSSRLFDGYYNAAHFLKIIAYAIPMVGLVYDYYNTQTSALLKQSSIEKHKREIQKLYFNDSLTQLLNRNAFESTLDKIIENAKRCNLNIAVLHINLDNFKSVNDALGHGVGDKVLQTISQRMKDTIRKSDYCARIGGDEFAIILPILKDPSNAGKVAKKVIDAINKSFLVNGHKVYVSASIGIAVYPNAGADCFQILQHSNIAMRKAKALGRNSYEFYTKSYSVNHFRNLKIETHMREAIEKGELYLVFQPKYDMRNYSIIGAEALVRWKNKELGEISPIEFIHIAENCGLIHPIGDWIINNALATFSKWHSKLPEAFSFSINLSPLQLSKKEVYFNLKRKIDTKLVPANIIDLEITESTLMESSLNIENILNKLNGLGISLSIDDFGTGYSSLSRIKSLPISTLKIDRGFIKDLPEKEDDLVIVESIINLAHNLKLNVIAEGIESHAQRDFLISKGCIYGQGYLMSKPLIISDFEQLL